MEFGDYFPKIVPNIEGGQNHIPAPPLSKYWGVGPPLDPPVSTPMPILVTKHIMMRGHQHRSPQERPLC